MKKIAFSDKYELTDAVLTGRKTMTRRVDKKLNHPLVTDISEWGIDDKGKCYLVITYSTGLTEDVYPPYQIGEEIAIAQSYNDVFDNFKGYKDKLKQLYKKLNPKEAAWNNKMFVKASMMPHRICITDIKVERLQDISEEDCAKEGIIHVNWRQYLKQDMDDFSPQPYKDHDLWTIPMYKDGFLDEWAEQKPGEYAAESAKAAFAALIDRICGRGTWERNPWVFAYSFKVKHENEN